MKNNYISSDPFSLSAAPFGAVCFENFLTLQLAKQALPEMISINHTSLSISSDVITSNSHFS